MKEYLERMRARLVDFEAYAACLSQPPYRGVRVNSLRLSAQEFAKITPFSLSPVAWEPCGFYIEEEKPGKSVYHDAGLFYVQEPSAMCAAPLLDVRPGERVLDLCSAPGGKGTQLAQAMRGEGLLVLNEKMPDRARVLLQNVERMGICNAVVLCADPAFLAERFAGFFDKILVDAPCSGEGMFRKEPAAVENWSPALVTMCAERQKKILDSARKMLAEGGRIVYSTCTFSEEEDEQNAEWFVRQDPSFRMEAEKKIYPHRERGEGHYAALFVREGAPAQKKKSRLPAADRRAVAAYRAFERDFLTSPLEGEFVSFGNSLSLVPEGLFPLDGLKVLRAGLHLGEYVGGRFEPSHALALGVARDRLASVYSLGEEDALRYLRGEELPCDGGSGWGVAAADGWPLGLVKASSALKNHYPKGLRRR